MTNFDAAKYRSPLDDDGRLSRHDLDDGWTFWAIRGGVGAIMPMPYAYASAEQRGLYLACRDANLTGICPACGATYPIIMAHSKPHRGAMVHENDCPIADGAYGRMAT